MKPVADIYEEQLIAEGVLTPEKAEELKSRCRAELEKAYESSKSHDFKIEEWTSEQWESVKEGAKFDEKTGIAGDRLRELGLKIATLPDDWSFHPMVKKIYETRRKSIQEGKSVDWGTSEALAFASLIDEGFHVRVSG